VIQYYISIHHTHIRDIYGLLPELIVNSEFGDISLFVVYGTTGVAHDYPTVSLAEAQEEASRSSGINKPPPGVNPDIWLINLLVHSVCTYLRLDPWNHYLATPSTLPHITGIPILVYNSTTSLA
jgi:hypothetical protein